MKRENKKKLPKSGAKRYGHSTSMGRGQAVRMLAKRGYFAWWIQNARRQLGIKKKGSV